MLPLHLLDSKLPILEFGWIPWETRIKTSFEHKIVKQINRKITLEIQPELSECMSDNT